MPITLTIHLFGLVFTLKVKRESRHSAKWRLSEWNPNCNRAKPLVAAALSPLYPV